MDGQTEVEVKIVIQILEKLTCKLSNHLDFVPMLPNESADWNSK